MEEYEIHKIDLKTLEVKEAEKEKPKPSGFGKTMQDIMGFILKYNPIDPINDFARKVLSKFDLEDKFVALNWWGWAFPWIRYICRAYWNLRVEGEMFPEYGGIIYCTNHVSHIDPFFVSAAIQRRVEWMSKEENFETPLMRTLFKNLGAFPVKRGEKDEWAYNKATKVLEKGGVLGMFPEGTRSYDGTIGEFRSGSIRLAIENEVPIVPGCVIGSKNALPKGKLVMKPATVTVRVGEPIYYDGYYGKDISYEQAQRLAAELREKVVELHELDNLDEIKYDSELSIGGPTDAVKSEKRFNIKDILNPKKIVKNALTLVDDWWYGLLRSLEVFDTRSHFQEAIYNFSGNLVHEVAKNMIPYKTIDFDKYIPEEGGIVVCPSHNSEWDVIILAVSMQQHRRIMWQMAKQSLFDPIKVPIVNAWVRTHHAFPLKRGMHDVGCFEYGRELCEKGEMVCVYPEGTTNTGGGEVLPFHTGAVRMAIQAKVPILPVGITGSENIYPKHGKMLNFGKGCVLKAGEPFMEHAKYFDEIMPNYEVLKDLSNKLRDRVVDLLLYNTPEY